VAQPRHVRYRPDGRGGRCARCVLSGDVAESAGHLVWIDCEMTGLDIVKDKLIEVAVVVTDSELNVLDPGLDLIIGADDADLDGMNEVVVEMHRKSGLTDAVRASTLTVAEAEQQVLAYIKRWVPDRRTAPLCGNSIGTDRGFLARDMPELDDHLHYRMVDVSSIKELARRWFPRVYFAQPQKGLAHRALADIIESVRELAYYRRTLFVPAPGPNSDQAKGAADEVVGAFAEVLAAGDATPRTGVDEVAPPAASGS
jgi:oligoribonuclease